MTHSAGTSAVVLRPQPKSQPRRVSLTGLDPSGCTFEVANDVEAYRIEQYGGEVEFTRAMLAELRPGDVFYDIGACVGLVTVHAAKKAAKVFAFEPDPAARSRLNTNIGLNSLPNVTVLDWAVSDAAGEVTLFTDPEGKSASLRDFGERMEVKARTDSLDAALARGEFPPPDVIKLDIEGAELLALQGMHGLLGGAHPPRQIFVELHPVFLPQFGADLQAVEAFIASFGYQSVYYKQRDQQIHAIYAPAALLTQPAVERFNHNKLQVLENSRKALAQFKDKHQGQRCVIIGNGPSLNKMDLSFLRNEITFGMNRIYLGFEKWGFTPTYYVSVNPLVIEQSAAQMLKIPAPRFLSHHGIPFFADPDQAIFIESLDTPAFARDPRLGWWEGYTVTYAAMQLAYFMGFSEVILIGVDHSFSAPGKPNQEIISGGQDANHFDPNYFGKGVRWHLPDLKNSEFAYTLAKYTYRAAGRTILDATVDGKLTIFPKADHRQLFYGAALPGEVAAPEAKPPLISVILPSSGNAALLNRALKSVENQTYPNIEIITVGDDGNIPAAEGCCSQPLMRIALGEKASLGTKLNAGLALARGETIAYLGEGESYLPDHLAVLQLTLQNRAQFLAAYAQIGDEFPAPNGNQPPLHRRGTPGHPFDLEQLLVSNYIPLSCLMHRREALGKTGGFDENLEAQVNWDFLIRLALAGKFIFLPTVTIELLASAAATPTIPSDGAWIAAYHAICRRYADHASLAVQQAQQALLASLPASHGADNTGFPSLTVGNPEYGVCERRSRSHTPYSGVFPGEAGRDDDADCQRSHEDANGETPGELNWPVEVAAWVEQANTAAAQGDFVSAIEPLRQALNQLPADPWLNVTLGNLLLNTGCFEDARRQFVKSTVFHPQDATAHQGLGAALWQLGESEKALAAFHRAQALAPEDKGLRALLQNLEAAPPPATPAQPEPAHLPAQDSLSGRDVQQVEMANLQNNWNAFGEKDPMWAILTRADKKGNRWQPGEFFETGIHDIESLLSELGALGISIPRRAALDFGCGLGRLTQALAMQFEDVHGIDIAPSMIEEAQRHNRFSARCHYRVNAANDLRMFADAQFDLIYTIITLQHIRPQYTKNYLCEFLRALSPQGVLVFQLPSRRRDTASSRLPGVLSFDADQPVMEMHGIEKAEVLQLLAEHGGSVVHLSADPSLGAEWESWKYYVRKE